MRYSKWTRLIRPISFGLCFIVPVLLWLNNSSANAMGTDGPLVRLILSQEAKRTGLLPFEIALSPTRLLRHSLSLDLKQTHDPMCWVVLSKDAAQKFVVDNSSRAVTIAVWSSNGKRLLSHLQDATVDHSYTNQMPISPGMRLPTGANMLAGNSSASLQELKPILGQGVTLNNKTSAAITVFAAIMPYNDFVARFRPGILLRMLSPGRLINVVKTRFMNGFASARVRPIKRAMTTEIFDAQTGKLISFQARDLAIDEKLSFDSSLPRVSR